MAYADTPKGPNRIKDTQAPIRTNFSDIQAAFSVNHAPISGGFQGAHAVVTYIAQLAAPAAPPANEILMYALNYALTAQTELFIEKSDGIKIPFTARDSRAATAPDVDFTIGYTRLPSGLLLKYGTAKTGIGASPAHVKSINLNSGGAAVIPPYLNTPYACLVTELSALGNAATYTILTAGNLTVRSGAAVGNVSWFTIGV